MPIPCRPVLAIVCCMVAAASAQSQEPPRTANELARLSRSRFQHGGPIAGVAFSADGKRLASASADRTVRVWDTTTGKQLQLISEPWPRAVALSADGKLFASGNGIGGIRVWNLDAGGEPRLFPRHQGSITALAFSSDGAVLASASSDHTVRFWETQTGRPLHLLAAHQEPVRALAFSPDDSLLATAGADRTLRRWRVATGAANGSLDTKHGVNAVAFSPDGKRLAFAEDSGGIGIWDGSSDKAAFLAGHPNEVHALAFSRDGNTLVAVGSDNNLLTWKLPGGQKPASKALPKAMGAPLAFSPDGRTLLAVSPSHALHLWDLAAGKERQAGGENDIRFTAAPVDVGPVLALAVQGDRIILRERKGKAEDKPFLVPLYLDGVASAISPAGKWLAAGTQTGVTVIDAVSDTLVCRVPGTPPSAPKRLVVSPDSAVLAIWTPGHPVALWDLAAGKKLVDLVDSSDVVSSPVFSGDAGSIFALRKSGMIQSWDARAGTAGRAFGRPPLEAPVALSPDARIVAAGGDDGTIVVFDAMSGKAIRTLHGHDDKLESLAFAPDGRVIASGGGDQAIALWELSTGKEIGRLVGHFGKVTGLTFSPDGKLLASQSSDASAILWDVTELAKERKEGLSAIELDAAWSALAGEDAGQAHRAIWSLALRPKGVVPFLADRLRPFVGIDSKKIAKLIDNLNSDDFKVRERATDELESLSDLAEAALTQALLKPPSLEAQTRIERILKKKKGTMKWTLETQRIRRVIDTLEKIGGPDARALLNKIADGAPEPDLADEAQLSLKRLTSRTEAKP